MSETKCMSCTATTTNGIALCERCQHTLSVAFVNVAAFYSDVLRIQPGQRVRVRSAYTSAPPPPVTPSIDPISATTNYVDAIVVGWVRNLVDDRPGISQPPADIVKACAWLEDHISTIVTLEWAGECLREMRDCERELQRLVDRSDTGWYAGVCGNEIGREVNEDGETVPQTCPRSLYGTQSSAWVLCPECGRTWDAAQRRDLMIREARDEVAPVQAIAKACVGLLDGEVSVQRLANRIDQWVKREKLHSMGVRVLVEGGKPQRVYRIGDVFDLLGHSTTNDVEVC